MPAHIAFPDTESRWTLSPGMFRFLLAAVVVIDHSLPLKLGLTAVFIFFMLSGYWVHVMWHGEYQKTGAPWRIFIASRFWRLLPVYFLALALYIAVSLVISLPIVPDPAASLFEKLHFYVSNLFILGLAKLPLAHRVVYPAWSLDIELQFYLIAPLVIGLAAAKKPSVAMAMLAAMAVCCAGYYLIRDEGLRAFSSPMPMYLGFFLIGLGAARFNWRPSSRISVLSLLAAAMFLISMIALHKTRALFLGGPFTSPIIYYAPAAAFMLALLMAPYAMATVRVDAKTRGRFVAATDRHFSNLTYEIYLLHPAVITTFNYLMTGTSRLQQMPFLPVAYAVILLLSWMVYRFYDQPIDKKRRDYVKFASSPAPVVAQLQPVL